MSFLKSYFAPGKGIDEGQKKQQQKKQEKKQEKKLGKEPEKVSEVGEISLNHVGTGRTAPTAVPNFSLPDTPIPRTPMGSRPGSTYRSSLYPTGDFRNARESLIDVKADVMCSWLYQQQLERQYATGILPGEGVVLKKGRNNYACCPSQLREMKYSLYDMATELNVRVRNLSMLS